MNDTQCDMPFGECPYCGHKWKIDDWWEYNNGDVIPCTECDRAIILTSKNITVTFTFQTKE